MTRKPNLIIEQAIDGWIFTGDAKDYDVIPTVFTRKEDVLEAVERWMTHGPVYPTYKDWNKDNE